MTRRRVAAGMCGQAAVTPVVVTVLAALVSDAAAVAAPHRAVILRRRINGC